MTSMNDCLPRSTLSSVYFDIAFATLSANIDEERNIRINDDGDTATPELPDKPSWWFYNFRIYSQTIILLFNVAKIISAASKNDINSAILSAVRSICISGIITRHYYLCNYKFMDIVQGKLKHLMFLQILFMSSYAIVGAISASVDPFFASDWRTIILFYLLPVSFRGLSFVTASLYSKMMTKTAADGTIIVPELSTLMIFNFYGTIFFFSLAGSNSASMFFADRLLCGVFFILPFASFFRNLLKREQKREKLRISQKESTSYRAKDSVGRGISISQIASLNNPDQIDNDEDAAPAAGENNVSRPFHIEDGTTRGGMTSNDPENVNTNNNEDTSDVHNHKVTILDLRREFTENKIYALITPVSCTFMIIMSFELAMSMYLYHRDGVPANWCEPYTFQSIDKGFQIVLDYFL